MDYLYIMKRVKLLCLLGFCLLFPACEKCIIHCDRYEHNLLIYMAADNSLSDISQTNMTEIVTNAAVPSDHALFVYIDRKNQGAFLIRAKTRNSILILDTLQRYGDVNSMEPQLLSQVIGQARDE